MAIAANPVDWGDRNWWRGATIYQIYPRSFQDTSGDGVGDLTGIRQRLEHVARLGADAVWISPFFKSPMKDFGYDVEDYRAVDPMFGTNEDFDAVIAHANDLGLRIMIDLVFSHTADTHAWFKESRKSRDNAKSDWYVWADPAPDGTVPNNWLSMFGGSSWTWDSRREQYYLHNFLSSQPDLNLHNHEVQQALLDVLEYWLKKGVGGFRFDVINFYFCDRYLRDNPPLPRELRNDSIAPSVNPYNHQLHLFDKNQPENLDFLRRLRAVMEPYGAAAVGEIGDAQKGLELMAEYTSGNDKVHMCYPFELLQPTRLTAPILEDTFHRMSRAAPDAWPCWAYSNHDTVRLPTRWQASEGALKAYAVLLMCLRGSACIYQGEELGLPEAEVAYDDLQDPYGKQFWPEFKGRDGARTPMVWEDRSGGGFSTAQKPWLPVSDAHLPLAVERQEGVVGSMLEHYRLAIALRKDHPTLRHGAMDALWTNGDLVQFLRLGTETIFCAFNLGTSTVEARLPEGNWTMIGADMGSKPPAAKVRLDAFEFCLAIRA
ncbi:alpha-amylase family glycosyl hydrolase [Falsirhodobacter halotolerans]|uniref:alpha-amylase family glycosyl hydrolase n=1 Tax=Falsirhodobacter halotolerans TaxID=1146892 RepID=UPI001FD20C08|nr:alpha-amylase family glycosyl hydrolase [Falsirhodobacter halotolerans]MCJ8139700.1 alpha-amylase family glycosyl hydrolase [Falsirhodobacter halotolerans]